MRRPLHTLKIWGAGFNSPRSYGAEFVFLLFFLFVRHATLLGTKAQTVRIRIELGGTGIRPPDSFSYRSNFVFVPVFVLVLVLVLVLQQAATYSIAAVAGN